MMYLESFDYSEFEGRKEGRDRGLIEVKEESQVNSKLSGSSD